MRAEITYRLSDPYVDAAQKNSQRQLALTIAAVSQGNEGRVPLNLCLILDRSGSMGGEPLDNVRQAACRLVDALDCRDRLSVIAFDHRPTVVVPNQTVERPESIKEQIQGLRAAGGTCIDEGLRLGLEEWAKGKHQTIGQVFLLTDGENEHGSNERCLKFAQLAAEYNVTLHTLGFGDAWNQDVLEKIADAGGGTMVHIQYPDQAAEEFQWLLRRVQSVGLTDAHLELQMAPNARLAEFKPIAQVAPDTIELVTQTEGNRVRARLGDLMVGVERAVLVNFYIDATSSRVLPGSTPDRQVVGTVQVTYTDPQRPGATLASEGLAVEIQAIAEHRPQMDEEVQGRVLALAKYRQTQLAEAKLQQGDSAGAATLLQTAAKTALQMGDTNAATVLQSSATRLQTGTVLSDAERKQTRIASKTVLRSE
ncbi:MAG TPA: hypothetical protein DCQ32_08405 [Cyanobacteria bacterium UBA8156]|nr:hypothetical protein [Cyanobacteria bacterium UBA8156]